VFRDEDDSAEIAFWTDKERGASARPAHFEARFALLLLLLVMIRIDWLHLDLGMGRNQAQQSSA